MINFDRNTRFVFTLTKELKKLLEARAEKEKKHVSAIIVKAITEYLGKEENGGE